MAPTIYPDSRADAHTLARTLLDAAGPGGQEQVQTSTDGPAGIAFVIPDDLYARVFASGDTAAQPKRPGPDDGAVAPRGGTQVSDDLGPDPAEPPVSEPPGEQSQPGVAADVAEADGVGDEATSTAPAPVRARRRSR